MCIAKYGLLYIALQKAKGDHEPIATILRKGRKQSHRLKNHGQVSSYKWQPEWDLHFLQQSRVVYNERENWLGVDKKWGDKEVGEMIKQINFNCVIRNSNHKFSPFPTIETAHEDLPNQWCQWDMVCLTPAWTDDLEWTDWICFHQILCFIRKFGTYWRKKNDEI